MNQEKRLQLVCRPEFEGIILICVDRNKMRIRKGRLRLSPNEEAALVKEETEKRRKLRLQQVREQSKENAAKIRHAVKQEKHKQLMKLATDIKNQLDDEKAERVRHLEQQYDNSLRNIGVGHKQAAQQPDWSEERELIQRAENLRADARGRTAIEKLKQDTVQQNHDAHKHIIARKEALEVEKARAAEIASMPPPPPDPLHKLDIKKSKPVKVTDINMFSTSHYHLQNEHAVDRAGPEDQRNGRDAAVLEAGRIEERALELRRLRQDQLERARLRHNAALEKELLKHDYNNILHDLSDLQRADRDRRLRIVHSIPKQVFEPPNARMEDREDKQRNLEEEFENMYMLGTNHFGDISMALDPQPRPTTPSQENSLDLTLTDGGTPIQAPTLPGVPPVLRDMTNMPKPRSPGKKPEKVLRSLMDRIKSQREDWITSQSMMEVGDVQQQPHHLIRGRPGAQVMNGDQFFPLLPDNSPMIAQHELSPSPEKLARVHSPVQAAPPDGHAAPPGGMKTAMPPAEFVNRLRVANEKQQTNVQFQSEPVQTVSIPSELQQTELAEVLRQQEIMMEQKRLLELKLQQLTYEQQKMHVATRATQSQPPSSAAPAPGVPPQPHSQVGAPPIQQGQPSAFVSQPSVPQPHQMPPQPYQYPVSGQSQVPFAQLSQLPGQPVGSLQQPTPSMQQFASSLSSSGMSQRPMNSIPPTHTTGSAPITTFQGYHGYQGQPVQSTYQPPSAILPTDQLAGPTWQQPYQQNTSQLSHYDTAPISTHVTMPTSLQGQTVSPGHIPPASLTAQGMSEQMRKVKEYQEHLLARHEQSKKVLDETKAEIKRRREHLLERYPNLDLSRLEELGAKHLDTLPNMSAVDSQEQLLASRLGGQGQSVTSLLASLAAHPYYAATLSQPGADIAVVGTTAAVGTVQASGLPAHPDMNLETNLRKNKLENIRKSLPFDADDSFQTPIRVYEAYTQKQLDTTDITETDTSTLTERGSPALKPSSRPLDHIVQQRPERDTTTTEESEIDTTASASFLSETDDASAVRQDELKTQLAEIQRQKEEIIRRHQQGQQKLQSKEEELKAKLATLHPEQLGQQLKESLKHAEREKQQQTAVQKDLYAHDGRQHQLNLSTILEVDTPSSTRPSDAGMSGSATSDGESMSQHSKKSLDFLCKETIPEVSEQSGFEEIETQMQSQSKAKERKVAVADYSGKNIDDVLERAKRFEQEVLQKLRKQTNAVLFDNEFDDSLEFSVSRQQVSADPLSSGSLTPNSFSTGPLDETNPSRQSKSTDGSFQNGSKSWATELTQYKFPPSNQADLSFKLIGSESSTAAPINKPSGEATVFASDKNRFKVYSDINETGSGADTSKSDASSLESSKMESTMDSFEHDSMNAGVMLQHLKNLQQQLRKGEEERNMLAKKLAEQQRSTERSTEDFTQYSIDSGENVSRPFMPDQDTLEDKSDLSQYSYTDKSTDVSVAANNQSGKERQSPDFPIQSGTSSLEKALPVRRSPIGDNAKPEPHSGLTAGREPPDLTTTEYSFALSDSRQQRSTSTPGDERIKPDLHQTHHSELPSQITASGKMAGKLSQTDNSEYNSSGQSREISSYSMPYDSYSGNQADFETLLPDRHGESPPEDLTRHSGMTAEESLERIKKEFERLEKPIAKVKTFAVNRDGDLISEHSDSDKSLRNNTLGQELPQFTISSTGSAQDKYTSNLESFSGLSSYTIPESTGESRPSQLSEYSYKSSLGSCSVDANRKSSSFTNVTSDPSLNMTGTTNLSQYTLNETKEEPSGTQNENGNNYVQQRFASLDNLISESKNIIARHKQIINKNKNSEEDVPNRTSAAKSPERGITSGVKSLEKATTSAGKNTERVIIPAQKTPERQTASALFSGRVLQKPKSNFLRSQFADDISPRKADNSSPGLADNSSPWKTDDSSPGLADNSSPWKTDDSSPGLANNSSPWKTDDSSLSQGKLGNQSSTVEESSLDYLTEHGSGIMEEPVPDLTSMTLGSEISISEAFNKTEELSDSADSLQSFEKHEMSDTDTPSTSRNYDDVSMKDSVHDIVEARRHNFMVQMERRANAAKERALAAPRTGHGDQHQVFRAVPVNVVAQPTLSMSVNAERGTSPNTIQTKGPNSLITEKKSFDSKEKEMEVSASSKALNRALQPRGWESPTSTDSGIKPRESGMKPKESSLYSRFGTQPAADNEPKSPRGNLVGEIRQFGGMSGLAFQKPSPPTMRKTPPKVAPKPIRSKPAESQPSKPTSGLSKTLSSWKKSRAVTGPPKFPEPIQQKEAPKNSIKVLPQGAPAALTDEERRRRAEDELYEKNIRAYNPRLFRLQHKLDNEDSSPQTSQPQPDKSRDAKKQSNSSEDKVTKGV